MSCGGINKREDQIHREKPNMFLDFYQNHMNRRLCSSRYHHKVQHLPDCIIQMEHSYSRDWRPTEKTMLTRTLMVHRAPQCPSCHLHTNLSLNGQSKGNASDEGIDVDEPYTRPIPMYDHEHAREAKDTMVGIVGRMKNNNSEDADWEEAVGKVGWTPMQQSLFARVVKILALDRLSRLAHVDQPHEAVLRRADVSKSASRMRKALATVHWDPRLTQWLHGLLMEHLPPSQLAAYLDIIQTLRNKVPTLVDKMMVYGRSATTLGHISDLQQATMRPPWEPQLSPKDRKLPNNPVIVIVPDTCQTVPNARKQRWISLFGSMASVVSVNVPTDAIDKETQVTMGTVMEHLVTLTRLKLQDLRKEAYHRPILLVGVNAGSAVALQAGVLEPLNIASIICMGFASNTTNGIRGHLDDQLVELQTPVLFVIGQNAAKTSQEEMEALREQMIAPTSLVVVGSADDSLRVGHSKRKIECVTQSMVDNMIIDEVAEFSTNCLLNPPVPRSPPVVVLTNGGANLGGRNSPSDMRSGTIIRMNGGTFKRRKLDQGTGTVKGTDQPRVAKKRALDQQTIGGTISRDSIMSKLSPPKREYRENVSPSHNQILTSYEIVPGKVTQKFKSTTGDGASAAGSNQIVGTIATQSVVLPVIQKQKISMIPSNQFIPLKPIEGPHQQMKGNFIMRQRGEKQQLYTIRTMQNGHKIYTIRHQSPAPLETIELDSPDELAQMETEEAMDAGAPAMVEGSAEENDQQLLTSDILDLPILFADNEGNIQDSEAEPIAPQTSPIVVNTSVAGSLIQSTPIPTTQTVPKATNKVVFIKNMKTQPNIISKSQKYVLVNAPDEVSPGITTAYSRPGNKIEILNSTIIKPNAARAPGGTSQQPMVINMETIVDRGSRLRNVLIAQQQQQQSLRATQTANRGQRPNKVTTPRRVTKIIKHVEDEAANQVNAEKVAPDSETPKVDEAEVATAAAEGPNLIEVIPGEDE